MNASPIYVTITLDGPFFAPSCLWTSSNWLTNAVDLRILNGKISSKTSDVFAPIRNVFEPWVNRCKLLYVPGNITIDDSSSFRIEVNSRLSETIVQRSKKVNGWSYHSLTVWMDGLLAVTTYSHQIPLSPNWRSAKWPLTVRCVNIDIWTKSSKYIGARGKFRSCFFYQLNHIGNGHKRMFAVAISSLKLGKRWSNRIFKTVERICYVEKGARDVVVHHIRGLARNISSIGPLTFSSELQAMGLASLTHTIPTKKRARCSICPHARAAGAYTIRCDMCTKAICPKHRISICERCCGITQWMLFCICTVMLIICHFILFIISKYKKKPTNFCDFLFICTRLTQKCA